MSEVKVAILIPVYNPVPTLPDMIRELIRKGAAPIVIVDDGSSEECAPCFDEMRALRGVKVLNHAINLGKGAALKTALNFAYCEFPDGLGYITADADGQHAVDDILAVAAQLAKSPESLVMGVRSFAGNVPFRSRAGNRVTRTMVHLLIGQRLADTQTGLRGIPRCFVPRLLKIPADGYEFELDMLIAAKHASIPTLEVPIQTIYLDGNRSSRFDPFLDSMKIYFVLLRFSAVALVTAILDNAVFFLAYTESQNVLGSQIAGRIVAVCFNYAAARKAVFHSDEPQRKTLLKYLALVFLNASLSYALISAMSWRAGIPVLWAKLIAETLLFLGNFALQREFVFTGEKTSLSGASTDWTQYYERVPPTARITRKYSTRVLVNTLKRLAPESKSIIEIGGANSCFVAPILRAFEPDRYRVIDTNEHGLELLRRRFPESRCVTATNLDVLHVPSGGDHADVVFSVGLVEHFSPSDTARAVRAHFKLVKPSGLVIVTFPTPTKLYRVARAVCEFIGVWKFPDERPLDPEEVLSVARELGTVEFEKILWPLVFTQYFIAVRARAAEKSFPIAEKLNMAAVSK